MLVQQWWRGDKLWMCLLLLTVAW